MDLGLPGEKLRFYDHEKLIPYLAPYKVAVLPLIKKSHGETAREIYYILYQYFMTSYDDSGNIGKRYRRCDAIGTPLCINVDDVKAFIEEKIKY